MGIADSELLDEDIRTGPKLCFQIPKVPLYNDYCCSCDSLNEAQKRLKIAKKFAPVNAGVRNQGHWLDEATGPLIKRLDDLERGYDAGVRAVEKCLAHFAKQCKGGLGRRLLLDLPDNDGYVLQELTDVRDTSRDDNALQES